jgi:5-methylcytosine-specific restriction endonuclease McrA
MLLKGNGGKTGLCRKCINTQRNTDPEFIAYIKNALTGHTVSEETRQKMREKQAPYAALRRGVPRPQDVCEKIRQGNAGKPKSQEHIDAYRRSRLRLKDAAELPPIDPRHLVKWAKGVKNRDSCCQYCGSQEKLHAHHIISKTKHPEFAEFINNGLTLCHSCHGTEHRLNGYL